MNILVCNFNNILTDVIDELNPKNLQRNGILILINNTYEIQLNAPTL